MVNGRQADRGLSWAWLCASDAVFAFLARRSLCGATCDHGRGDSCAAPVLSPFGARLRHRMPSCSIDMLKCCCPSALSPGQQVVSEVSSCLGSVHAHGYIRLRRMWVRDPSQTPAHTATSSSPGAAILHAMAVNMKTRPPSLPWSTGTARAICHRPRRVLVLTLHPALTYSTRFGSSNRGGGLMRTCSFACSCLSPLQLAACPLTV